MRTFSLRRRVVGAGVAVVVIVFAIVDVFDGQGGAGLGLPIVRGIVRGHSGEVRYEDGAFVIRLPLDAPSTANGPATAPKPGPVPGRP